MNESADLFIQIEKENILTFLTNVEVSGILI